MKNTILTALITAALLSHPLHAAVNPRAGVADQRIKTFVYDEQEVYQIMGYYGYSTTIQFAKSEIVETVSLGDSAAWQVIPTKSHRNTLMIKPLLDNAHSNLTVLTNKRVYSFELSAAKSTSPRNHKISYRIAFQYPADEDQELANYSSYYSSQSAHASLNEEATPDAWNFDYTFSGNKTLHPVRTFDDGKFTYFQFSNIETTPAIYTVDEHGKESLINFVRKGKYIVVEKLARQFTLRDGKEIIACIFNEGFPERKDANHLTPKIISDIPEPHPSEEIIIKESKETFDLSKFPSKKRKK
jgi:type IV secretion system protein VirB9